MILSIEVECKLYEGASLKTKRSILKRNMHKLQKDFNIAITELDYHDLWQRTKLGIVTISNERAHLDQMSERILEKIDSVPEWERILTHIEHL